MIGFKILPDTGYRIPDMSGASIFAGYWTPDMSGPWTFAGHRTPDMSGPWTFAGHCTPDCSVYGVRPDCPVSGHPLVTIYYLLKHELTKNRVFFDYFHCPAMSGFQNPAGHRIPDMSGAWIFAGYRTPDMSGPWIFAGHRTTDCSVSGIARCPAELSGVWSPTNDVVNIIYAIEYHKNYIKMTKYWNFIFYKIISFVRLF